MDKNLDVIDKNQPNNSKENSRNEPFKTNNNTIASETTNNRK